MRNRYIYLVLFLVLALAMMGNVKAGLSSLNYIQSVDLSNTGTALNLYVNPSGTVLYTIDSFGIEEYNLTIPFDLTTAIINAVVENNESNFNITVPDRHAEYNGIYGGTYGFSSLNGIYLTPNGNELYISGAVDDGIYSPVIQRDAGLIHFHLNTPFSINSRVYINDTTGLGGNIYTYFTQPYISSNGNKLLTQAAGFARLNEIISGGIINNTFPGYNSNINYNSAFNFGDSLYINPSDERIYFTSSNSFPISEYVSNPAFIWNSTYDNTLLVDSGAVSGISYLTYSSISGEAYLFIQLTGESVIKRYSFTPAVVTIANITSDNPFVNTGNSLKSLFPDASTLSSKTKWAIVIISMFATALILFLVAGSAKIETSSGGFMTVVGLLEVLLFLYFVSIQYISIGVLLLVVLFVIGAIVLGIKSKRVV